MGRQADKSFKPSPSARSNANPGSEACSSTIAGKPDNIFGGQRTIASLTATRRAALLF